MGFYNIPSQSENWEIRKRLSLTGRLQLQYKSIGILLKIRIGRQRRIGATFQRCPSYSALRFCTLHGCNGRGFFYSPSEGKAFVLPLDQMPIVCFYVCPYTEGVNKPGKSFETGPATRYRQLVSSKNIHFLFIYRQQKNKVVNSLSLRRKQFVVSL